MSNTDLLNADFFFLMATGLLLKKSSMSVFSSYVEVAEGKSLSLSHH